jgi:germacradienol/geosmin synthase
MLDSWLWELDNQRHNRIPDPVDYVEMRRHTFGSELTMSLARFSSGSDIPPEVCRTRPIQSMENSAMDFACLLNDMFSYQKEIQFEGELHNGVLVVQNFLDCDKDRAYDVVNNLMTARVRQFEHVIDLELPVLFEELDTAAREALLGYADKLRHWMSGILNWHSEVDRYREEYLRFQPTPAPPATSFAVPSGLGTSAARVGSLLRTGG